MTDAIKITDMEFHLLNLWARCEMNQINGARPDSAVDVNTYIWADERAADMKISARAVGGIMTSLSEKGLVHYCIESDKDESGVMFSEAGYDAWAAEEARRA
jgi:hypothetical protein